MPNYTYTFSGDIDIDGIELLSDQYGSYLHFHSKGNLTRNERKSTVTVSGVDNDGRVVSDSALIIQPGLSTEETYGIFYVPANVEVIIGRPDVCTNNQCHKVPVGVTHDTSGFTSSKVSYDSMCQPNEHTLYDYYSGTDVKNALIGTKITSIGTNAFYNCPQLTGVTMPSTVNTIADYAFSKCTSLSSITIPNSVTTLGNNVFSGCTSLNTVTIGNGGITINQGCFSSCPIETFTAENVNISQSGMTDVSFASAATVSISSGTVGNRAFSGVNTYSLNNVENVIIGSGVTLGNYVFYACKIKNIDIPSGATIGTYCFGLNPYLTGATINNSTIPDGAFISCSALTTVTISSAVTSIGSSAFNGCSGLTSVTIPASVTTIKTNAFYNCSGLQSITVLSTTPTSPTYRMFPDGDCPIYVPSSAVDAYKSSWTSYSSRIQAIP